MINLSLNKKLSSFDLLVELDVNSSEITSFFGKSGCGKSTLLNAISGINKCAGSILINEEIWQDDNKRIMLPTYNRNIGVVTQDPVLFDHMNVQQVFDYALKHKSRANQVQLSELINQLDIKNILNRNTTLLSGGEKKKVCIVLAFLGKPDLVLLDEVTSGIDNTSRTKILNFIVNYNKKNKVPVFYVTHMIDEVLSVSDTVVFMENGKIVNALTKEQAVPKLLELQNTGEMNLFYGAVKNYDENYSVSTVQVGDLELKVPQQLEVGSSYALHVNSSSISISKSALEDSSILNSFYCQAVAFERMETYVNVQFLLPGIKQFFWAKITRLSFEKLNLQKNDSYYVHIKSLVIN